MSLQGLSEGGSHQGTRSGTSVLLLLLFRIRWVRCRMRFSTGGYLPPSAARYFSYLPHTKTPYPHPRRPRTGNLVRLRGLLGEVPLHSLKSSAGSSTHRPADGGGAAPRLKTSPTAPPRGRARTLGSRYLPGRWSASSGSRSGVDAPVPKLLSRPGTAGAPSLATGGSP